MINIGQTYIQRKREREIKGEAGGALVGGSLRRHKKLYGELSLAQGAPPSPCVLFVQD